MVMDMSSKEIVYGLQDFYSYRQVFDVVITIHLPVFDTGSPKIK